MKINYIIIHHSAVSREKNSKQFKAIDNYHKSLGWGSIGYHYLIEPDGEIRIGRREDQEGAHAVGHNQDSIGICLTGNFDTEYPTKEQETSLTRLLKDLKIKYPIAEIVPHRKFANKTCFGKLLKDDWANNLTMTNPTESILKLYPDGDIVQVFGANYDFYYQYQKLPGHQGIDIKGKKGTKIYSFREGYVMSMGNFGRGNQISIIGDAIYTYGHLESFTVKVGDYVKEGQIIGYMGNSGVEYTPGTIGEAQLQSFWQAPLEGGYHLHIGKTPIPSDNNNGYAGFVDMLDELIIKTNQMKLTINNGNQYLISESEKFGWSINNPEVLELVKKHFTLMGKPLAEAMPFDPTGYFIIFGSNLKSLKDFFNII